MKVLVVATTYPLHKEDNSAIFLKTLYTEMAKRPELKIKIIASDHSTVDDAGQTGERLDISRFQYWFRNGQILTYGDAILSNVKKSRWSILLAFPFVLSLLIKTIKECHQFRPNVIHAHWAIPCGFVAGITSRLFGIPLLVTSHGGDVYGFKDNLGKWLLRLAYIMATRVNFVSEALYEEVVKIYPDVVTKNFIQPMGVNASSFSYVNSARSDIGVSEKAKMILFVGRLSEVKGVKHLIRAVKLIDQKLTDKFEVCIVGKGNMETQLTALTEAMGLTNVISFVGSVPNESLSKYYSLCDVLVIPSVKSVGGQEGFPVTLMEGLMCNCNVVASKIGGMAYLDLPQVKLVTPGSETEIASAIMEMWDKPKVRPEKFLETFKIENVSDKFVNEYSKLIHP